VLPEVHKVEQQGEGDLQAGGQQGGVPPLGTTQEQARHELRDHGPRSQVFKICTRTGTHFLVISVERVHQNNVLMALSSDLAIPMHSPAMFRIRIH
jgi:hypothetical protein